MVPGWKKPKTYFRSRFDAENGAQELRYQAASHPILFELLPDKFTIPQLQSLYEGVYETRFDNRNFSRKVLSTELLIKAKGKR